MRLYPMKLVAAAGAVAGFLGLALAAHAANLPASAVRGVQAAGEDGLVKQVQDRRRAGRSGRSARRSARSGPRRATRSARRATRSARRAPRRAARSSRRGVRTARRAPRRAIRNSRRGVRTARRAPRFVDRRARRVARFYNRRIHGPRYRYRRPGFVHFHLGWWYATPWWVATVPIYRHSYRVATSCDYWADRCAANWGFDNVDYYGCLRYHGCY